jgi:hypothetical protein
MRGFSSPPSIRFDAVVHRLIDSFTVSVADALFHIHRNTAVQFVMITFLLQKVKVS